MVKIIVARLFEVLIAYICTYYILFYLGIKIPSHIALCAYIGVWLSAGHLLKRKLKYQGVFSSWYAPLTKLNEQILSLFFIVLSIYSVLNYQVIFLKDLFLYTITVMAVNFIYQIVFTKNKKALLKTLSVIAALQTYIIVYTSQKFVFLSSFPYFNTLPYIFFVVIFYSNYYSLRNFIFYQKLSIKIESNGLNLTYNEKLIISVHETSHLLMYSYYKNVPHDIQLLLFKEAQKIQPDVNGLVIARIPMYNTKEFLQWRMMLSISGIRGELLMFNAHSHGSESDFQQWRDLAFTYLTNFESKYVSQPTTAEQMNRNKDLESHLYNEQIYIVDKFLKNNKRLLISISRKALVFNKLNYNQIYPYFKSIKLIKELPRER